MKGFTLFLSIIALAAAGISGMLYMMVGNEKTELADRLAIAAKQLDNEKQRVADLASERTSLTARTQDLESQLNELNARNTTLEARNTQLSKEITQARDQAADRISGEQAVARQIADLNGQLLEARAAASAAAGGASAEQVAAYEARIADLEGQLTTLRRGTAQAAGSDPLANVPADLTANVIDVGPRAAFVILDIGSRNGAVPALEMVLRRGSVVVARVRLTDVRETYSVAHVLPRSGPGNVRPGDSASRS